MVAVPVDEARYDSLAAVKGGLPGCRYPLPGVLGEGIADPEDAHRRPALERFDLRKREASVLADEVSWFAVSGDGARLVIGDRGDVRVVPSDRKADNGSSDDVVNVDLARARFLADPAALWRHAYAEFGRLLRRDFWTPTMSDVDWDGVLEEYRFLLDRVRTSAEFGDLLWEVAGELGTSHAYVMPVGHVLRQVGAARPARGAARRRRGPRPATGAGSWSGCCPASRPTRGPARRSPPRAWPSGRATRSSRWTAARSTRSTAPGPPWPGTHGKPVELTIKPADPSLVPWPPPQVRCRQVRG